MDPVAITNAATAFITAVLQAAPAIERGIASSAPYVQAIEGLLTGSNATQALVDSLLAAANAASAQFQQPLPADDGSTTT